MSTIPAQKREEFLNTYLAIQNDKGRFLKQGKTFKMISQRYFTINSNQLVYYKEKTSQKIRGIVNLVNCTYQIEKDKKGKDGIKVLGQKNAYEIWLIPQNKEELQFYLYYLSLAQNGKFDSNQLEQFSNSPQKSNLANESRIAGSLVGSQQIMKSFHFNDTANGSLIIQKKEQKQIIQEVASNLNNNQSIIQSELNINDIQAFQKNNQNILREERIEKLNNSKMLNGQTVKSQIQYKQISQQPSTQKPINIVNTIEKYDRNKSGLRLEDCNVETTDDVPNTSFMNQYEFSYYRLDNKVPHNHQIPVSCRNSSSVGPQKRINMTKFDTRRSKSSRKEYINRQFERNLKYTKPFGGDENHNQLEYSEFLEYNGEASSSSVDFDQEQLYPTRKSLLEFEIGEICNDEVIHQKQNKNFTTKKSIKSNYQTSYQKKKNDDILSFDNYQDEDIDDTPPGLAKESPLLFQQLEFKKEFVRNSLSQFQNNASCIDQYKKVRMNRKLTKAKDIRPDFCYSEEAELTSTLKTESYGLSSSKHLIQLKEMFKKNQIISNLHESRLQECSSAMSIPGYDINDLEDDFYDINAQQNEQNQEKQQNGDDSNHKSITQLQLLEDQPFATKNFVQLDNKIRVQASLMKISDEISQQYLTFTDTEDCLSLISEKNNIGNQMNNYQSNGIFSKNIFKNQERQNILNINKIFDVKKEQITDNKSYFILMACHYIWNSQVEEANYILQFFPDSFLYKVEISLNLLLITGQIRYLESSLAEYYHIIQCIDKKDKSLSQLSEVDKKIILCEAHTGIALLKVLQDKKLSALSSINTAHNYLLQVKKQIENTKKIVQISDENKNRYLLADGLFQVGLSLMPSFFSRICNLLGIEADLKKGISQLTECMEMKQIKSNYARIILFLYYLESENNILQSSNMIKSSLAIQSTSPIFNWLASLYYWKIASSQNAVKFIKQAIDQSEKWNHHPHFFYFELGWFYLSQLKWSQATSLFENMIIQGFDFKQIDDQKFFKKLKSNNFNVSNSSKEYLKDFLYKFEKNAFGSKVKIMHKCCIAFIIGICYISSAEQKNSKTKDQNSGQKISNSSKQSLFDDESNNLIHQILSPISQNDQQYLTNKTEVNKSTAQNQQQMKLQQNYKLNQEKEEEPNYKELFYLWCNLSVEIYDKLGDSKTILDIEFRKIAKLFSTRTYTYLIKFELLYFVKELSKVSDENLDKALIDIKQYQEQHIQQFNQMQSQENLVEICSAYLLIIGISYIKDKFHDINEIAIQPNIKQFLNQINKKYQYISHHTYYWLGMSYKKNYMHQQAKHFFELSKQFKTNLFNLNQRIEFNLSAIIKNMKE
ncbi:hypothetical protein TTHERM_01161010 (macronuclear) [Tetrahymena thermophila SB210]|uniref:PH domain-containing protein n=1 Tax=Tetrahymena thermophila (strain SB210) TaxID=312017 RepID=Q23ND4_TETTS|nr:hypothetical protein TTHERM_01161010 [Tetrahymena thermophila SB210]EAR98048.2 hypothetical protein TTHERM_01161010 [Tetrahymena thermophila SB210]|eukprot:XP_001018293.2 hypothetical protein TTHERM_01161010 [Tetrahymena thermophila SB210]